MDWQKQVVRRTLEGAGPCANVQLELLLRRLEHCPGALPFISDAIADMGQWFWDQAKELEDEGVSREAKAKLAEIVKTKK